MFSVEILNYVIKVIYIMNAKAKNKIDWNNLN